MTTIAIRLHPAEVLNANQRPHWARKARLTASLRARATIAWRQAGSPHMNRAHVTVTLGYPDRRKRDAHNLMPTIKALIDGMVNPAGGESGLLPDDSDIFITHLTVTPGPVTPGAFTLKFTFEEEL